MPSISYIGRSDSTLHLKAQIAQIAPRNLPVQIVGETGTGKEVVARLIHEQSGRTGEFVAVDCAALSNSLVESELFGHVRGAFTGANRHRDGLIWAARGGTFFLDEVADLPLETQTRLLRLLQEGTYRPVGAEQTRVADIRVVGASWKDLAVAVKEGRFREDLYHRLAVVELRIEPLRKRMADLELLVTHFLELAASEQRMAPKRIDSAVWHRLKMWPWPGNIRELRNCMESMQAMSTGGTITVADLPKRMSGEAPTITDTVTAVGGPKVRTDLPYMEARREWLDSFQMHYVSTLLAENDGNVSATARAAGMDRRSIQRILNRNKTKITE